MQAVGIEIVSIDSEHILNRNTNLVYQTVSSTSVSIEIYI